jgi:hypothetical protein
MLKKFIAIADTFIPKSVGSPEDQFKARLILYPNLCAVIVVFCILMAMAASRSFRTSQVISYLVLMLLHLAFLFILKRSRSIERSGIAFLCALSLKTSIETVYLAGSPINSGMHNFPLYLIFGFFITSSPRKRAFLATWLLASTIVTLQMVKSRGFVLPYGQDVSVLVKNASIAIGLRSILALASIYWFVQIRNVADQELDREIDWQIRSERLNEILDMIKTMFPRLDQPLVRIAETLELIKDENAPATLHSLDNDVRQLKEIAQSIGWVYRAYRNEHIGETSSELILKQLQGMLERTHSDSGWCINVWTPDSPILLEGPMPSLIFLLLSLIDQIVLGVREEGDKTLAIKFQSLAGEQIWTLSWPLSNFTAKDISKRVFIEDLGASIKARICALTDPFLNLIEIRGKWQSQSRSWVF